MNRNSAPWTRAHHQQLRRAEELQDRCAGAVASGGGDEAGAVRRRRPGGPAAATVVGGGRRWSEVVVVMCGSVQAASAVGVGVGGVDGLAGEGEEDLVEGRAAQADVVDARCRCSSSRRTTVASSVGAAVDRRRDPLGVVRRCGAPRRRPGRGARRPRRGRPRSAGGPRSRRGRPWPLSSSGVPAAITWPWSTMTTSRASWSASSRYWVVSSTSVPSATRRADGLPQLDPAARVEARWSARRAAAGAGRPTRLAPRSSRRRMPPE